MSRIGIVTDSTADMPAEFYEEHGIEVVPLYVRFGDEVYRDWREMSPRDFYARMRAEEELPKTSQPSVEDFVEAYRKFEGYDGVLSVHISSKLSGTAQAASVAAADVSVPVRVVDGGQASFATGFILSELVKARKQGMGLDELEALARSVAQRVRIAFCVDTLKYLEMGGRIGRAKFLAGSLLKIRPILTLVDGEVSPYKNVKSRAKVLQEMEEFIRKSSGDGPLYVGYAHADAPEMIDVLRKVVRASGVETVEVIASDIGSVVGTYIGPGSFALALVSGLESS